MSFPVQTVNIIYVCFIVKYVVHIQVIRAELQYQTQPIDKSGTVSGGKKQILCSNLNNPFNELEDV